MRRLGSLASLLAVLCASTGCVANTPSSPQPNLITQTQTEVRSTSPSPAPTLLPIALNDGSATARRARCPYVAVPTVADQIGMRLARTTVLRIDGATVGCRFYAITHPNASCDQTCFARERLPGPSQPAVELRFYRYRDGSEARTAFILMAERGRNIQRETIAGTIGLCSQFTFYRNDRGQDWACLFRKQSTVGVVRTVVTSPARSVADLANKIAERV